MLIGQLVSQLGLHPGWCISCMCVRHFNSGVKDEWECVWLTSPGTSQWNKPLKRTNRVLILFNTNFPIIGWKIHHNSIVRILSFWYEKLSCYILKKSYQSQWNLAHAKTVQLSCNVQIFFVIGLMWKKIWNLYINIFSCDQAALWMVQSVCPSVRPSVCLSVCLSHLFDYVPIILSSWNFQELLPVTKVTSMQKVKVRGQRSRSQRSRPKFSFPDCNSSLNSHMMMKWYI